MLGMEPGIWIVALLAGATLLGVGRFGGGINRNASTDTGESADPDAIETLKERYVDGDIDAIEYERHLETLYEESVGSDGSGSGTANRASADASAVTARDRTDVEDGVGRSPTEESNPRSPAREGSPNRCHSSKGGRRHGCR